MDNFYLNEIVAEVAPIIVGRRLTRVALEGPCLRLEFGGPRYAVVVVAEGAAPTGGREVTVDQKLDAFGHARLGGIGDWLAEQIRQKTSWDARSVALGHPQRGGPPSPVDRIMGHLFGTAAVEACVRGAFGQMVSARGVAPACQIRLVPLEEATRALNLVDVARHYDVERYRATMSALGAS